MISRVIQYLKNQYTTPHPQTEENTHIIISVDTGKAFDKNRTHFYDKILNVLGIEDIKTSSM